MYQGGLISPPLRSGRTQPLGSTAVRRAEPKCGSVCAAGDRLLFLLIKLVCEATALTSPPSRERICSRPDCDHVGSASLPLWPGGNGPPGQGAQRLMCPRHGEGSFFNYGSAFSQMPWRYPGLCGLAGKADSQDDSSLQSPLENAVTQTCTGDWGH